MPTVALEALTPMLRQYLEIKEEHKDSILFFRMGDFYEMFFEDAIAASRMLGIALTKRNHGGDGEVPLCGVPHHSYRSYVAKLLDHGQRVAICEQIEDPKQAKGIVKRAVTRVITPGLQVDDLESNDNNYLLSVAMDGGHVGIAYLDISTGEFMATEAASPAEAAEEILRVAPREIIAPAALIESDIFPLRERKIARQPERCPFSAKEGRRLAQEAFKIRSLDALGMGELNAAIAAVGAIIAYVKTMRAELVPQLTVVKPYSLRKYVVLDHFTRQNLELFHTTSGDRRRGNLLAVLNTTKTAMGSRLLKEWMHFPLLEQRALDERLDAVESLVEHGEERRELRTLLGNIADMERLIARIATGHASGRDLAYLRRSLATLPPLKRLALRTGLPYFVALSSSFDECLDIEQLIASAIVDEPPLALMEGGLIREGYNAELDRIIAVQRDGKDWILSFEAQEKAATGIGSLKVRYNKVFGYYIEITNAHKHAIPARYERRQTLANAERYIVPELKEYESLILGAEDKRGTLEYQLYCEVRERIAERADTLRGIAHNVALFDVLASFADTSVERGYTRPRWSESGALQIVDGRHPVIEAELIAERFIPNDVTLDPEERRILLITGPNMAGKSTIMRQVALISFVAQLGCFVPARSAELPIVDRIFTRVGASDNISAGQSTFMVEMTETASILHNATAQSLIIMDEIGRGTSTFDGLSIAWAIAEHIHDVIGAKTLFATHYHELIELARLKPAIANYHVAVKEWQDEIIFLRKLVEGATSRSYGIEVAKLAGLPQTIIARSKEILANLESQKTDEVGTPQLAQSRHESQQERPRGQLVLFQERTPDDVLHELRKVDIDAMTPLKALVLLSKLKAKVS